ncbi:MAG: ABC transporter substrate-binding protein, partial [Actinomycetota bacterium]
MARKIWLPTMSRRDFLKASGLTVVAVACGGNGGNGVPAPRQGGAPAVELLDPASQLSGDLNILLWSHFVPRHDEWFDSYAQEWGQHVGVNVTVDHIDVAEVPARISSEISAGSGHDIMQYIAPIPQFEPSVVDLSDVVQEAEGRYGEQVELCRVSSYNPTTDKFFAYSHSWVPDPGDYRKSLWEGVGLPDGPSTWEELLEGGAEIKASQDVQMGIGMSQEIDSNMAGRGILWSFGAAIQDENENVIINTPEAVEAVEYMADLFEQTMTEEVFAW